MAPVLFYKTAPKYATVALSPNFGTTGLGGARTTKQLGGLM